MISGMQDFPHRYTATALAKTVGDVTLESPRLAAIASAGPAEFGGPGNRWSPETLLVAAHADCFVLGFRAVAQASKLAWLSLRCEVEGTLDRVERVTQFTAFSVRASLTVPAGTDVDRARSLLEKAEKVCLIANSLKAQAKLEATVEVAS
jgi:organic hydroperoxide reductase OsmC/OhrA